MKKFEFLILTGLLALAPLAWATDYQWAKVEAGEEVTGLRVTGQVVPREGALKIQSAATHGRVLSVLKREGEWVKEGTPLFLVDDADCISLGEELRLAQKNGVQDLVEAARQRETQLGVKVGEGRYEIVSLYSGVVTKLNESAGSVYNQGDQLATVLDTRRLTVEFNIPEKYVSQIRVGQKATFQLAADSQKTYTSVLGTIVPTIDLTFRTTIARLRPFPLPAGVNLSELVYGVIQTGANQPILKVPSTALVFSHDRQYVLKGGGTNPVAVPVQVVDETDTLSSVRPLQTGDLKAGDSVVSDGAIYLYREMTGGS